MARWLHKALESYRLPRALVGQASPFGAVPARLPPIFRDRDELPASADLGGELRAALAAARFQIVLCSPRSAKSVWVNEEILAFKRAHGEARVLPLIGRRFDATTYSTADITDPSAPLPDPSLLPPPAAPLNYDWLPPVDGLSGAIPEPASWLMLITGFGLIGAMQLRQRPRTA